MRVVYAYRFLIKANLFNPIIGYSRYEDLDMQICNPSDMEKQQI